MVGAIRTLDLCTFLLGRDALGNEIIEILIRRAREGVQVRLLIDGIGVYLGGRLDLKRLSTAGVEVALFVSPFSSALPGRTNLRNHRKMVIADGERMSPRVRIVVASISQRMIRTGATRTNAKNKTYN